MDANIWMNSIPLLSKHGKLRITIQSGSKLHILLSWNSTLVICSPASYQFRMSSLKFLKLLSMFHDVGNWIRLNLHNHLLFCYRTMQNTEKGRKISNAAASTSRAVAQTGKAVGKIDLVIYIVR